MSEAPYGTSTEHWLWKKESKHRNALFIDCFAVLDDDYKKIAVDRLRVAQNDSFEKSNVASEHFQELGERKFRKRKWTEAAELYNRGVCLAETGSKSLELALKARANCFAERGMGEEASIDMDLCEPVAKRRSGRIQEQKFSFRSEMNRPFLQNTKFPSLASALEIRQNSEFGRHIVAKCDICVGVTIAMDRQFAGIVANYTEPQQAYCLTCLRTDANFIPCPNCIDAMFCSHQCQQSNDIHQLECQTLFHRLNSSKAKLAIQLVLIAVQHFPKVDALMTFVDRILKSNNLNKLANDSFPSYGVLLKLHCCPNKNDMKRAFEAFNFAMMTMPMMQCYFNSIASQRFLMHLLVHHLGVIRMNGFYDTFGWTNNLHSHYIYDTISLLNHSCAPNAHYMYQNNVGTLVTVRPIKKGTRPKTKIEWKLDGNSFFDI